MTAVFAPGSTGKVGHLTLSLELRGGRTVATRVHQRVPLHVGRVLHQQRDWPELGYITVANPTGGFVEGDRVDQDITVRSGAAHITSQSASRVYRCPSGAPVRQHTRLGVGAGAYLEWWPDPVIPFAGALLEQTLDVSIAPAGVALIADTWLIGRVARDERHAYRRVRSCTRCLDDSGEPRFVDTLLLDPAFADPTSPAMVGNAVAVATFFVLGGGVADEFESRALDVAASAVGEAGVSRLPDDAGLIVRVLSPSSEGLRGLQHDLLTAARTVLCQRGPVPPTKMH